MIVLTLSETWIISRDVQRMILPTIQTANLPREPCHCASQSPTHMVLDSAGSLGKV